MRAADNNYARGICLKGRALISAHATPPCPCTVYARTTSTWKLNNSRYRKAHSALFIPDNNELVRQREYLLSSTGFHLRVPSRSLASRPVLPLFLSLSLSLSCVSLFTLVSTPLSVPCSLFPRIYTANVAGTTVVLSLLCVYRVFLVTGTDDGSRGWWRVHTVNFYIFTTDSVAYYFILNFFFFYSRFSFVFLNERRILLGDNSGISVFL